MNNNKKNSKGIALKDVIVGAVGVIALLYLLNFTFGVAEFLPDNIPVLGNVDEVAATYVLGSVLAYFGMDVKKLFSRT